MSPQLVTLITLGISDLRRSKNFYGAMCWVPTSEVEGEAAFYQINGFLFGLFGLEPPAKDQGRPYAKFGTGASTLAQNFTTEAEVDEAYALALKRGETALKAVEKLFGGGYSGYYADPDGHVWELAMNPPGNSMPMDH